MFSGTGEEPLLAMLVLRLLLFLFVPDVVVVAFTRIGVAAAIGIAVRADGVERPLCGVDGGRTGTGVGVAGMPTAFVLLVLTGGIPSQ